MAILVTGGAGYIGSHTCVELLEKGYEVIIADNFCNSKPAVLKRIEQITGKGFKSYDCDIRDKAGLKKVFEENSIDAVIHFAGLKAVGESCKIPLAYYENNVFGTMVLCDVMSSFNVKRLVFSSSATVYGFNPVPYVETMATGNPSNPYGRTKLIIEEMLNDIFDSDNSWHISVLRYFNPIGAHKSGLIGEDPCGIPNNLLPYILKVASGKLPVLTVFGNDYPTDDGTCIRDYIHVVDLAKAHIKAIERLKTAAGLNTYNIGTGKGNSVLNIIEAFEKETGVKINYTIGKRRSGDVPEMYADVSKAYNELGWKSEYTIEDMCRDSWNWQKKNPCGYDDK